MFFLLGTKESLHCMMMILLVKISPFFFFYFLFLFLFSSIVDNKSTVNILDDIGSMFDDLADQLDAMLD